MSELRKVYSTVDARDRIVEAALSVFARQGYDGATTREIAAEAGVSAALIHHHFKDKAGLWNLVGQRISDEFVAAVTAAMDPALRGSGAGVRQMIGAYLRYWHRHPRALRFQLWRVLGAPADERKARSEQLNRLFVPEVEAAQRAGDLRTDVPPGLLMVTVGGLIQYFLHSDVETRDALAVTGAPAMGDESMLDYLWGLIAPPPQQRRQPQRAQPRPRSAAQKRRAPTSAA